MALRKEKGPGVNVGCLSENRSKTGTKVREEGSGVREEFATTPKEKCSARSSHSLCRYIRAAHVLDSIKSQPVEQRSLQQALRERFECTSIEPDGQKRKKKKSGQLPF